MCRYSFAYVVPQSTQYSTISFSCNCRCRTMIFQYSSKFGALHRARLTHVCISYLFYMQSFFLIPNQSKSKFDIHKLIPLLLLPCFRKVDCYNFIPVYSNIIATYSVEICSFGSEEIVLLVNALLEILLFKSIKSQPNQLTSNPHCTFRRFALRNPRCTRFFLSATG